MGVADDSSRNPTIQIAGRKPPMAQRLARGCFRGIRRRFPLLRWLPSYRLGDILSDTIAGITVALTVIPQGLAYAVVADLPPQYGLYSGFMGCFAYIVWGGTRVMTIGPTALLALITFSYTAGRPPEFAVFLAFAYGFITALAGLLNLGFLVDFVSAPVTLAFTSAAAITIASTQVKGLLGLSFHADGFLQSWIGVIQHIQETRLGDTLLSVACIALLLTFRKLPSILACCIPDEEPSVSVSEVDEEDPARQREALSFCRRLMPRTVWLLSTSRNALVVVVCALIAYLFTLGDSEPFLLTGHIQPGLPPFTWPPLSMQEGNRTFSLADMSIEAGDALAILPLLGVMEHVAIARAFAGGETVDASQEMVALGLANVLGSCVLSMPITGSFTRSCVNHASGVRTPLGGLFTGVLVLLALAFLTPSFYFIPKASLSSVIVCAVLFMVEYHLPLQLWRTKKIELIPATITFVVCLVVGPQYGMLAGIAVGLLFLLLHAARPLIPTMRHHTSSGVPYLLARPDRSLLFPSSSRVRQVLEKAAMRGEASEHTPLVVDCRLVAAADFTATQGLKELAQELSRRQRTMVLWRAGESLRQALGEQMSDWECNGGREQLEEMLDRGGGEVKGAGAEIKAETVEKSGASSEGGDSAISETNSDDATSSTASRL